MNIIFFGTPDFVIPVAQTLKDNFNLISVVTTPDEPAGRNHLLSPPPMKIWAQEHNVPVLQPEKLEIINLKLEIPIDLFVVAAYGKILPQSLLEIPRLGAINIHPSHLPEFRGPTPVPATILSGLTSSAVSIIQMDAEMDHGPILTKIPFQIKRNETTPDVLRKVFNLAAAQLPSIIQQYNNEIIKPTEQQHENATYCQRLTKLDGFIDLDNPPTPEKFDQMVRAYYPWPNVWTKTRIKNQELRIKFLPQKQIQIEGKRPVDVETFYRGYPEVKEKIKLLYQNASGTFQD